MLVLNSIARAVARQNVSGAFVKAKAMSCAQQEEAIGSIGGKKGCANRRKLGRLSELAKLWTPVGARLVLAGVRDLDSGFIVSSSSGMAKALNDHWAPTFGARPLRAALGRAFLKAESAVWNFKEMRSPCELDFLEFLKRAPNSAAGPDGLP